MCRDHGAAPVPASIVEHESPPPYPSSRCTRRRRLRSDGGRGRFPTPCGTASRQVARHFAACDFTGDFESTLIVDGYNAYETLASEPAGRACDRGKTMRSAIIHAATRRSTSPARSSTSIARPKIRRCLRVKATPRPSARDSRSATRVVVRSSMGSAIGRLSSERRRRRGSASDRRHAKYSIGLTVFLEDACVPAGQHFVNMCATRWSGTSSDGKPKLPGRTA